MTATMAFPTREPATQAVTQTVTRPPAARLAVTYRAARPMDVPAIVALINDYAARGVMLPKSPDAVALALDDFIVAADQTGRLLGCAAIREYSPSIAEVGSVAVVAHAHGTGIGGELVRRVERLAACRGVHHSGGADNDAAIFRDARLRGRREVWLSGEDRAGLRGMPAAVRLSGDLCRAMAQLTRRDSTG